MSTIVSRLFQAAWCIAVLLFLARICWPRLMWAWQCARVWADRRHRVRRHELSPWRPLPIRGRR